MASDSENSSQTEMGTLWQNKAFDMCKQEIGETDYQKRMNKTSQVSEDGVVGCIPLSFSLTSNKSKKLITSQTSLIRRCHGVGAVGYATVQKDERIPTNNFFKPKRRFRIRFRHSNINCEDDAGSCIREAAIKFSDQNMDGPLDLILFTGRTALARNSNTLSKVLRLKKPTDYRNMCMKDPHFYHSLVDGLRRGPTSFASLTYYSQIAYQFEASDGHISAVRFRLVASENSDPETGLLSSKEQETAWEMGRRPDDTRTPTYLVNEFTQQLHRDEPVTYMLQIQINNSTDLAVWNPQVAWDDHTHPWLDLILIQLTTFLPVEALAHTYFNIVEKPVCLSFPCASSSHDYCSLQRLYSKLYTEFEMKRVCQLRDAPRSAVSYRGSSTRRYRVTLCTEALKEKSPRVDVFLTLVGTESRTIPQRLEQPIDLPDYPKPSCGVLQHYLLDTEDVGQVLAAVVAVRYRQLTDDWYMRYIAVFDAEKNHLFHFPCHSVVQSKVTLRTGEVCLATKQQCEVHRQERLFELVERQMSYQWCRCDDQPYRLNALLPTDLPTDDKLRAAKYTGMRLDIMPEMIELFRELLMNHKPTTESGAARAAPPILNRQMSLSLVAQTQTDNQVRQRRATVISRQTSSPAGGATALPSNSKTPSIAEEDETESSAASTRAKSRWKKVRNVIKFISDAPRHLPDGAKGDMCRAVVNDEQFARYFLAGPNPTLIKRCKRLPDNLPVTEADVEGLTDRGKTLTEEIKDGRVYLVDYEILRGVHTKHHDADHRYLAAPLVLLYVRSSGDLVPLAIQLQQDPGPDNPVWTPRDTPEQWILAKLWVRCADYHVHFALSHIFHCHDLMEPFVIATMRQLPSPHPVFKLLKQFFRYTLTTNKLIRDRLYRKGGCLDRYTSLGAEGFQNLAKKYWRDYFDFEQLDFVKDLIKRGVENAVLLPGYHYRDDGRLAWDCVRKYCTDILGLFYHTDDEVAEDGELHLWLRELNEIGFQRIDKPTPASATFSEAGIEQHVPRLKTSFQTRTELADMVTKIVFALTFQHSATHSDALDLYGFIPDVPALMRQPPPKTKMIVVNIETLMNTLPEQFPDAYYASLAHVMHVFKPDENVIGTSDEFYFVEPEALDIKREFRRKLNEVTQTIKARNTACGLSYDQLMPCVIPASAEPLPYVAGDVLRQALVHMHPILCRESQNGGPMNNIPYMTVQFARTLGGRSFIGRRLSAAAFSRALTDVGIQDQVNVDSTQDRQDRRSRPTSQRYRLNSSHF